MSDSDKIGLQLQLDVAEYRTQLQVKRGCICQAVQPKFGRQHSFCVASGNLPQARPPNISCFVLMTAPWCHAQALGLEPDEMPSFQKLQEAVNVRANVGMGAAAVAPVATSPVSMTMAQPGVVAAAAQLAAMAPEAPPAPMAQPAQPPAGSAEAAESEDDELT